MGEHHHLTGNMSATELRQRSANPYSPYVDHEAEVDSDTKGHPPPAKQVGVGMMIGMAIAAVFILGFVYYIEEEKWSPDWEMHSKVVAEHKKKQESHRILSGIHKDIRDKHERG